MNKLMKFEGNDVNIINHNGEILFEIYSTGMALGYARNNGKSASEHGVHPKLYPYKSRIDKVIENAEISVCVHDGHSYITESQLYDFMLESRTEKCRAFRKWVTNEVLPTLRKTGTYTVNNSYAEPKYIYDKKTYNGIPVLTTNDLVHIFKRTAQSFYNKVNSIHLAIGKDYLLLQGEKLKNFLNENPDLQHHSGKLYIFFKSAVRKLMTFYGDVSTVVPDDMIETSGYVVSDAVLNVTGYIRRELKGIEALTYLLESNDTPEHLMTYREILVRKLANLNYWKTDASLVKLGIHAIHINDLKAIHCGDRGIEY